MSQRVEVSKGLFGRQTVHYLCPRCRSDLKSPLTDAGKPDHCPDCGATFTVPGRQALEQHRRQEEAARQFEAERKAEAERHRQQQREEAEQRRRDADARRIEEEIERERIAAERDAQLAPVEIVKANPRLKQYWLAIGFAGVPTIIFSAWLLSWMRSDGLRAKLHSCESYGVVSAKVYYRGTVEMNDIVFDLQDGHESNARRIDPIHLLMQFSAKCQLRSIGRVYLARNGREIFYISADDLERLSDSYAGGGRPWAFNNLPSRVRRLDGSRPFEEWSGGWLGVLKEQAEDLNDFIRQWTGY